MSAHEPTYEERVAAKRPPACCECARLVRDGSPMFWKCGASGNYITLERMGGIVCGASGLAFKPMPLKPPRRSIWRKLFGGAQ